MLCCQMKQAHTRLNMHVFACLQTIARIWLGYTSCRTCLPQASHAPATCVLGPAGDEHAPDSWALYASESPDDGKHATISVKEIVASFADQVGHSLACL